MLTLERNIGGGEGWGLNGNGARTLDDDQTFAEEGFALGGSEALHGGLTTVVSAEDLAIALADEDHLIFSPGAEVAVLIDHLGHDEGGVLTLVIGGESDVMGGTCGLDGLFADNLAVFAGYGLDLARIEGHAPTYVILGA